MASLAKGIPAISQMTTRPVEEADALIDGSLVDLVLGK
jgi:hypothetical protein